MGQGRAKLVARNLVESDTSTDDDAGIGSQLSIAPVASSIEDLLAGLNPEQREVVLHDGGPCRVVAMAGTGKTESLSRRVARLVRNGVDPSRILTVTFTTKAAEEMQTRISKRFGVVGARIGTWHSLCLQILKQDHTKWSTWTIEGDGPGTNPKMVLKDVIGWKGMDWKGADVRALASFIGLCKANLFSPDSEGAELLARKHFGFEAQKALVAFFKYNEALAEKELLTFDDYLVFANEQIASSEKVRLSWAARWDHILCDEVQDNSPAQERLVHALARDHRNYMGIGDCIPAGQMISTPAGPVPIENVRVGDEVLAVEEGKLVPRRVIAKTATRKTEALEFDLGEHGCFRATKEHTLFASIGGTDGSYLYLMYRVDAGFRIGVSMKTGRHNGRHFLARTQQEQAERMWILDWFETYNEAAEVEAFLAYEFGIPREPFAPREGMWSGSKEATSRLFSRFGQNGRKLIERFGLSFDKPNYFAKASARGRISVNILMATKDGHRVEIETMHATKDVADQLGMLPTGKGTHRTRRNFRGLREARAFAQYAAELLGGYTVEHLSGVEDAGRRTMAVPAASVHVGMRVPVTTEDGRVVSARVEGRRVVGVDQCFDLEVEDLATFVVNGVVVHNCMQALYRFRGSDPTLLANFADWPEAKTIVLPRNYRSGTRILDAANKVLMQHPKIGSIEPTPMIGERGVEGEVRVICTEALDDEANEIGASIQRSVDSGTSTYSGHMVLVRTNAQTRGVEESLLTRRIPYVVVGGLSFYERKEVRDLLAYLRLANGTGRADDVKRSINAPFRFLGAKFVEKVMEEAEGANLTTFDWADAVENAASRAEIQARQKHSAREWTSMLLSMRTQIGAGALPHASDDTKRDASPARLLEMVVKQTGYIDFLNKEEGSESTENSGAANVREMIRVAERFPTADELLSYIDETIRKSRQQREDKQAGGDRVTIMTVHRAKGLENDHVYVIGFNEMILPHVRGEEDEERRIAYVAMTRARDSLTLSYVRRIATRVGIKDVQPSRFLVDTGLPLDAQGEAEVFAIEAGQA